MECWLLQKKAVLPLLLLSLVFSPSLVAEPAVAASYAWANNPQGNVYNNYDLPAMPFRANTASN
jgi:hypothetical protein